MLVNLSRTETLVEKVRSSKKNYAFKISNILEISKCKIATVVVTEPFALL